MSASRALVKSYNELAIKLPESAWSPRFHQARLELTGDIVTLHYEEHRAGVKDWVQQRKALPSADVEKEVKKLKQRQLRKSRIRQRPA